MALEIIGAGFGRTGTESMKRALEILGYGPCYHMHEVMPHKERYASWISLYNGGPIPDWDKIFSGYRATVDWPAAHFWRELADCYPVAKIILTVRSSESWYASMENTILPIMRDPDETRLGRAIGLRIFGGQMREREAIIEVYERHTAEVQAAFGPDRLLTYELASGWEPLCRFLDVPVPASPFPRGNDADQFDETLNTLTIARENSEN